MAWHPRFEQVVTWAARDLRWIDVASGASGRAVSFTDAITDAAFSPDGRWLGLAFEDGHIELLDAIDLTPEQWVAAHQAASYIAWPSDTSLLTGSLDGDITAWSVTDRDIEETLVLRNAHDGNGVVQLSVINEQRFASLGTDDTIRIWGTDGLDLIVESPRGAPIAGIGVAQDPSRVLFLDEAGNAGLIHLETGELTLVSIGSRWVYEHGFAGFNPTDRYQFATYDLERDEVLVYELEVTELEAQSSAGSTVRYRNAKVVLVGDSGVGKSGLALALTGRDFQPTESTHGRSVWKLAESSVLGESEQESREVLLWDLAGQPGYRSFHKLSLRDVAVGIVVFDARSESDPFRGVPYWARALDEVSGESKPAKILVSARADRGALAASQERTSAVKEKFGFSNFVETSAKRGDGIPDLSELIDSSIRWEELPVIIAPETFVEARVFVAEQKGLGVLIQTTADLYAAFCRSGRAEPSSAIFETCLWRLETAGLIARLSIRDEWLLQPELLDSCVAYMAQAARAEPDGLGRINEIEALQGDFPHEPLAGVEAEKLLLLTAVGEVVQRNLALRVPTDDGLMLVFPSERRTDLNNYPDGYDRAIEYQFAGAISSIYAAVAVKLANSLSYGRRYELFHNAALFYLAESSIAGFTVDYPDSDDESSGRLVVFFSGAVPRTQQLQFLRYVDYQLRSMVAENSLTRARLYSCCGLEVPAEVVAARRDRKEGTVICPICETHQPMDGLEVAAGEADRNVVERDRAASERQDRQQRLAVLPGREEASSFHVFLCHNSNDRPAVVELGRTLRQQGLLPWIDNGEVLGGDVAMKMVEEILGQVPAVAVLVGPSSIGRWQEEEYYAALSAAVNGTADGRRTRLIPVLLPGAEGPEVLPAFLAARSIVDLRRAGVGESPAMLEFVRAILDGNRSRH